MNFEIQNELKECGLRLGVVCAPGVTLLPTPAALRDKLAQQIARSSAENLPPPSVKDAVRGLLRSGGFKPSGRSKPASEYLAQAAREDRFPFINNLVDINNYISLVSGLPASLLDLDLLGAGVRLRYGRPGERYVFNAAGQEMELQGLICICRAEDDRPCGNPVKDGLHAKIQEQTRNVAGFVFAPSAVSSAELESLVDLYAALLVEFAGVQAVDKRVA